MAIVYKMIQEWSVHIEFNSSTGTRKYMSTSLYTGPSPVQDAQELPLMSEAWSDEMPNLKVINIIVTRPKGCDGYFYKVQYSTAQMGQIQEPVPNDEDQYPITISISSANTTATNDVNVVMLGDNTMTNTPVFYKEGKEFGHWVWESDQTIANDFVFSKREVTLDFTLTREVYANSFNDFHAQQIQYVGSVNSRDFMGISYGNCLYLGCNARQAENWRDSSHKWIVEQSFSVKSLTADPNSDSNWNRVYRPELNNYQLAITTDGKPIYEYMPLELVITINQTNTAANIFPNFL